MSYSVYKINFKPCNSVVKQQTCLLLCKGRSCRLLLPLHHIMYTTGMLQLKNVYKEWVKGQTQLYYYYYVAICSWFLVFLFGGFLGFFRFFKFLGGFALGFFILVFLFWFWFFGLVLVFCDFVILIVVAYCTQLLSQAIYNLMMAAMAETCSC